MWHCFCVAEKQTGSYGCSVHVTVQITTLAKVAHSLVFVQNTEGIQKWKVCSNTLKVLLGDVAVMVMVIVPEYRLPKIGRAHV